MFKCYDYSDLETWMKLVIAVLYLQHTRLEVRRLKLEQTLRHIRPNAYRPFIKLPSKLRTMKYVFTCKKIC